MEILVCIKQVPDDSVEISLDEATGKPALDGVTPVVNAFDTYAEGIEFVAKILAKAYLNPAGMTLSDGDTTTGRYYSSPTLTGINTRYSTDPNWCTKVFSYMTYFYDKL